MDTFIQRTEYKIDTDRSNWFSGYSLTLLGSRKLNTPPQRLGLKMATPVDLNQRNLKITVIVEME